MTTASVDTQIRDQGTTLIELIMALVVMAVIGAVMMTIVATFLRNDESAEQRIDESRDLQLVAAYLPFDVSSAFYPELIKDSITGDAYRDSTLPSAAVTCPGYSAAGANVLSLKWSETFGSAISNHRVQYRIQTVDGDTHMVRVSCSGATLGSTKVVTVARQLRAVDPVTAEVNGGLVKLTLNEESGRTLVMRAATQNPEAELETTSELDT